MGTKHATRATAIAIVAVLAVVLAIATAFATPAAAAASGDTAGDEAAFVDRLNALRRSKGAAPLQVDGRLVTTARAWSSQMAGTGQLAHNPNLRDQAPSDWQKLGENVGLGGGVDQIHDALVASPGHYANLVDPAFNVVGIGVVRAGSRVWVTQMFMKTPAPPVASSATAGDGYRVLSSTGAVFAFGAPADAGAPAGVVGGANAGNGRHWLVTADGGVHARGGAPFHGSLAGVPLSAPIVGMAATPSGNGYWLLGRDGGVFSFGDAAFYGSTGDLRLNQPVVGMTASPTGRGYWFVAADGGIFAFGDATFHGSTGAMRLNAPIVGMSSTRSGGGYWLVASDGGVFAFGDAPFHGSTGHLRLNAPIVGMTVTASGNGYRFVAADGGLFSFGDAAFHGSAAGSAGRAVVGVIAA